MARRLASRVPHRSGREEGGTAHEKPEHVPVMLREVLRALAPKAGDVVVDATYGQGGHSKALKKALPAGRQGQLLTMDADQESNADITANFADLGKVLDETGVKKVDKVLFDLGWNQGQLAAGRGFSFLHDEPLSMSYATLPAGGPRSGFTAADILNTWSEKALADVFFGYGEERYARRIAKAVVARRKEAPFKTTLELSETIADAVPPAYRRGRLHPATRTFQALRIAVNDELGALQEGLNAAWRRLNCGLPGQGGRIAAITFHSIEDRVVKRAFADFAKKDGNLLYKKPLTPSVHEVRRNPSARSAKLRAIEKICD